MNEPAQPRKRCDRCGAPLSAAVAEGLCTHCLTRSVFANDSELSAEQAPPFGLGQRLGDYELLERIGRGGAGIVYRARQINLDREVAVKVLLDSTFAGPEELARFRGEAAAAAGLHHPNIVAIHEVGEEYGQNFFSMDFVAGQDLAVLTRQGPLPARQAAELVMKVAGAVQHSHEHVILHRDLKPSNVLVDLLGEPRVTDFGLAKKMEAAPSTLVGTPSAETKADPALSSSPTLTLTGQIVGTPGYMSPEQAAGRRTLGPATDIYSLGALLYHVVTARAPFAGETPTAILRQVEEQEPVPPRLLNPSLPRDLETICLKCLAKEPSRRYSRAGDLKDDLGRFLEAKPIRARPVGAGERAWRWCRRRPGIAVLLVVSGILLLAVIGVTVFARLRLQEQQRSVRQKDYVADMRLVDAAIKENNLGHALTLLNRWRPHAQKRHMWDLSIAEQDLRNFEWRYFRAQCSGDELATLGGHADRAVQVVFSRDGERVASASADGVVRLWNTKTRELLGEGKHDQRVMCLAFSPDDRRLASGGYDRRVKLWEAKTLRPLGMPLEHNSPLVTLRFSADGRTLATVARHESVVWDVTQQTARLRQPIAPSAWFYGAISPRLDLVALPMSAEVGVKLWNFPATVEQCTLPEQSMAVAFSNDGSFLAVGEESGLLRTWALTNLNAITTLSTHGGVIRAVAWSPDGHKLASGGRDSLLRLWEMPSGKLLGTYRGHGGAVEGLAFSPDGGQIASCSADGTVKIWDATQAPSMRENPLHRDWGWARQCNRAWAVGKIVNDTQWIDFTKMRTIAIPVPSELCVSNTLVTTIDEGFLVFGPATEVHRFDHEGRLLEPPAALPHWPLSRVTVSPDGRWIVWKPNDDERGGKFCRIGSTNTPFELGEPETTWFLCTYSGDSHWLAATSLEGEILVWNLRTPRVERRFHAVHATPTGLTFSINNTKLVLSASDGTIQVWNTLAWDKPPVVLSAGEDAIWCVAISPDEQRVAGGGDDGNVFLWDLNSQQVVARFKAAGNALVHKVGFSPSGEDLIANEGPAVFIWHAPALASE